LHLCAKIHVRKKTLFSVIPILSDGAITTSILSLETEFIRNLLLLPLMPLNFIKHYTSGFSSPLRD